MKPDPVTTVINHNLGNEWLDKDRSCNTSMEPSLPRALMPWVWDKEHDSPPPPNTNTTQGNGWYTTTVKGEMGTCYASQLMTLLKQNTSWAAGGWTYNSPGRSQTAEGLQYGSQWRNRSQKESTALPLMRRFAGASLSVLSEHASALTWICIYAFT